MILDLSSLRIRFATSLVVLLILALAALVLIGRFIVYPTVIAEERGRAAMVLDQLERAIDQEKQSLLLSTKDWATWDDTYAFVQGKEENYARSNFSRNMFEDLDMQMMLFLDSRQRLVWGAGIDPVDHHYSTCAGNDPSCEWMGRYEKAAIGLLPDSVDRQIARIGHTADKLFYVALHPILRTDESGPPMGWLVQFRMLDEHWQRQFETNTGRRVALTLAETSRTGDNLEITTIAPGTARVSRSMNDLGQSLLISTDLSRNGFESRLTTMRYALWWTAALLLAVITLILALLEQMVLRPLRQLARYTLQAKGREIEMPKRLLQRRDEVGRVSREFHLLIRHQWRRNSQLLKLSRTDHLTGLANRRQFDDCLGSLLESSSAQGNFVALILIDIDEFKAYNDNYGHPAGDHCLVELAKAMNQVVESDIHYKGLLARIGGEEFALVLPDANPEFAERLAERLCHCVAELRLPHLHSLRGHVTISLGVAVSTPDEHSASTLISRADRALYHAKENGRDRVTLEMVG